MSYLELLDFSRMPVFLVWLISFVLLNIFSVLKKKSICSLITLIVSIAFLVVHIIFEINLLSYNIIIDFISIIVSIAIYIFVDDIEARRKVISEVFENRYKNRSKK